MFSIVRRPPVSRGPCFLIRPLEPDGGLAIAASSAPASSAVDRLIKPTKSLRNIAPLLIGKDVVAVIAGLDTALRRIAAHSPSPPQPCILLEETFRRVDRHGFRVDRIDISGFEQHDSCRSRGLPGGETSDANRRPVRPCFLEEPDEQRLLFLFSISKDPAGCQVLHHSSPLSLRIRAAMSAKTRYEHSMSSLSVSSSLQPGHWTSMPSRRM